jgi:hypothetical protein
MASEFEDLTAVALERRKIFRPEWFRDLLAARLGLGDTFWIGNYGVALVFVPLFFFIGLVAPAFFGQQAYAFLYPSFAGLSAIYQFCLIRAVFICARRTPEVGGWRWVGVAFTVLNFATSALLALLFTFGALSV